MKKVKNSLSQDASPFTKVIFNEGEDFNNAKVTLHRNTYRIVRLHGWLDF